jgi:hypothetical protein
MSSDPDLEEKVRNQFKIYQTQLETQMQAQNQTIAELQIKLAAATSSPPPPAPVSTTGDLTELPKDPKVPDVALFNGDPKQSFQFLAHLDIFFSLQPIRYSDPLLKSYYLGLRCTGPAATWFNNIVSKPDSAKDLARWDTILADFRAIFDDSTRLQDAERSLLSLRQGKRSLATVVPEFQTLVSITGWDNKSLFPIFLDLLNDDVRDELLREPRPDDFNIFVVRAISIDRTLHARRIDRARRQPSTPMNPRPPLPPPSSFPTSSSHHQRPTSTILDRSSPMDLSHIQTSPRRGPLTPEERSYRMSNNLCLICGKNDHLRANCPIRRQDF